MDIEPTLVGIMVYKWAGDLKDGTFRVIEGEEVHLKEESSKS